MANVEGGDASRNAGGECGGGEGWLRTGQWTGAEDVLLKAYVQKHGEGNWNKVPKNTGLRRCGKSCRLRWANHLRPNLKKTEFSLEEEEKIVELHAKYGNKWARMAVHLEGRTDNAIKNFWNTRSKKRRRAHLPIYPLHIIQNQEPNYLSSLLQNPNFSHSQPTVNFNSFTFTSSNAPPYSADNLHSKLMPNNNGGIALSLSSSNQPFSTSSSSSTSHGPPYVPPNYNQVLPHTNFHMNALPTTMGASFNGFTYSQTELHSIQNPFDQAITQASSTIINNQSEYMFPSPSTEVNNYEIAPQLYSTGSCGFWGDLLSASQALMRSEKGKGKGIQDLGLVVEDHETVDMEEIFKLVDSNTSSKSNLENLSPSSFAGNSAFLEDALDDSHALLSSEKEKGKELQVLEPIEDSIDMESIFMPVESNTSSVNNLEDSSTRHSSYEMNGLEEINLLTVEEMSSLLHDTPLPEPLYDFYASNEKASSSGKSYDNVYDGNVEMTMDMAGLV